MLCLRTAKSQETFRRVEAKERARSGSPDRLKLASKRQQHCHYRQGHRSKIMGSNPSPGLSLLWASGSYIILPVLFLHLPSGTVILLTVVVRWGLTM